MPAPPVQLDATPAKGDWRLPGALAIGMVAIAIALLRAKGRIWWCAGGDASPWITDVWSSHCSQHLVDPYTFSHLSHGLLFYIGLNWLRRLMPEPWRARFSPAWMFLVAIAVEVSWELLENSPALIERYRGQTVALNYTGDSVINSIGDIVACAIGFLIALKIGAWRAFWLVVAFEVLTALWIRDNLTLNVVMLTHPIEAIKQWQMPRSMR
ncbi:MAG: DUF2585 family protein [Phycisphaeraceae bacterium]|nr:DUF2585 family protein [Phycisphaeraceae bacterium]